MLVALRPHAEEWQAPCLWEEGCQVGSLPLGPSLRALFGSCLDVAQLQLAQNYLVPNYNNLVTVQREDSFIKRDGLDATAGLGNS